MLLKVLCNSRYLQVSLVSDLATTTSLFLCYGLLKSIIPKGDPVSFANYSSSDCQLRESKKGFLPGRRLSTLREGSAPGEGADCTVLTGLPACKATTKHRQRFEVKARASSCSLRTMPGARHRSQPAEDGRKHPKVIHC